MKIHRVLVLRDSGGAPRDLRLVLFEEPIEIEFRTAEEFFAQGGDPSVYEAIAAAADSADPAVMEKIGQIAKDPPPVLIFQGEPPVREIARWVAGGWTGSNGEGGIAGRLLSENLEYFSLASLYHNCLKILSTQDDEQRLLLITDTFLQEIGAESCVVWLSSRLDPDQFLIASVRGVIGIDREGSRFYLSQTDMAEAIWGGIPFVATHSPPPQEKGPAFLYIPLICREKPIGLLKLGGPSNRRPFSERDIYVARVISEFAAAALDAAERIQRVERITLRDADTGAYSAAFLSDYFEKEQYKAGRFRRPLSVVFVIVDNFNYLIDQTRESLVLGALSGIVEAMRKALRDSDLIARVEPNRFCIVLPETDNFGSILALRRLRKAIRDRRAVHYLGNDYALQTFFLSATYPRDGRDLRELWSHAEAKHAGQRKSPYHRLMLQEKGFWEAFETLVGRNEYYEALGKGEEVPYFTRVRRDLGRNSHFILPREMFHRMLEAVAQDVVSPHGDRELVIAAGPRPEIYKQIFLSFGNDPPAGRNIYVIGQSGSSRFDAKNLLYVNAEDEKLRNREILLFLKENSAYGILARGHGEGVCGFNTSDEWVVEGLMEKVQDLYALQGTF